MDRADYDVLTEVYRARNAVAHGVDLTCLIQDLTNRLEAVPLKLLEHGATHVAIAALGTTL